MAAVDFDTRARMLQMDIDDHWEDDIKKMWRTNKQKIREGILFEYGVEDYDRKLTDFIALGAGPWSVVALHNTIIRGVRTAFVSGGYYAALVGAAGLGERILNQVTLELRDDFGAHPATKYVAKKESFDDWDVTIRVLEEWSVLSVDLAGDFKRLRKLRNKAIHYNIPSLDRAAREEALEAVSLVQQIIERLFHPDASQLIPDIAAAEFLRLEVESDPFVRHFFIPACALVSPRHEWVDPLTIRDDQDYDDPKGREALTDEEFAASLSRAAG